MGEVVVSIATIRQRTRNLVPVLGSLLHNQSLPPDRVIVWISPEPFLLDEGCDYSDLPEQVRSWHEDGAIEVRTTPNTGPHRKAIPLLMRHRADPDPPIIVTADDDTLYPFKWLEALVTAHRESGSAVCFRGRIIARTRTGLKRYNEWPLIPAYGEARSRYIMATGREGLLIRPDMFDQKTFSGDHMAFASSRCDAWLAGGLISGGTEVYKLSMARVFPDPQGLELAEDYSLPRPSRERDSCETLSTRTEKTELWLYNQSRNDSIMDETFRYFGIIEEPMRAD